MGRFDVPTGTLIWLAIYFIAFVGGALVAEPTKPGDRLKKGKK